MNDLRSGSSSLMYFRFTVGRYLKRIISQLSLEVTIKFKEEDECLKYMNAEDFLIEIEVLQHATMLFPDGHLTLTISDLET